MMNVSGVTMDTELGLCVFPTEEVDPFVVERASVRWVRNHKCGLVFGEARTGVKRQIGQLWKRRIGLGPWQKSHR